MDQQRHNSGSGSCLPTIRVLHIVSTFAVKTDTKWLHRLIGRLPRDRFRCAIACMYDGGAMMQRFADLDIPTFNLDAPGEISLTALRRAYRLIQSFAPDIVHTHLLRADTYGGLAGRLARVPSILSTGYAIGPYRRAEIRRLDGVLDWFCRLLATDALAVSLAVRDDMVQRGGWPADRVRVVHTGIDLSDEPPSPDARRRVREEWAIPSDCHLALTVARLSHEKGIDVLIRAADIVQRSLPNVRFVVVGDGPMKSRLQRQIDDANLHDVVRLAGFRQDIDAVLAAGDLFILPSLMEGMPNAILEAYNLKLPVVATRVGGIPEAVEHDRTGLLVPPRDPKALGDAIMRIVGEEPLGIRLAQQGKHRARECFSAERVADRYGELYEYLCRINGARRAR